MQPSNEPTVQLHRGDCLEFLAGLDPGSVDAVVTDPPYGIAHRSNRGTRAVKGSAPWQGREIAGDRTTAIRDAVIAWAEQHGKPWAAFGTWKQPTPDRARGVLVWDKGPAVGMGDLTFPWKGSWEEIAIGGPGWAGRRDEGVMRGFRAPLNRTAGRLHPHQKPVDLIRAILAKLPRCRTVLDPFMGSGSTAIAAIRSGLNFIGCEIDPGYFDAAESRIRAELNRAPLFAGA